MIREEKKKKNLCGIPSLVEKALSTGLSQTCLVGTQDPGGQDSYLVIQVRAGERVGRRRWDGRGRHVVDSFQRRSCFDASWSTGHGGHPERWWRYSKPGLGENEQRHP